MNRNLILIISLFATCLAGVNAKEVPAIDPEIVASPAEDELETMKHLITVTEQQLAVQKQLRNLMAEFKKQKDRFFKGDQSNKHSFKMVKTASTILQIINDNHLQHLCSSEYLEELTLFSSIAGKNTPARP